MSDLVITSSQARELTDRIKFGVEAVWDMVKQAYVSRAWAVLGYDSWDDYCTREFGASRIRLPREERHEVVASMRELGMSVRAIASATGASIGTVQADSRRCSELNTSELAPVTGTDGKSYPAAQPPREVPKPITDPIDESAQTWGSESRHHPERESDSDFINREQLDELNKPSGNTLPPVDNKPRRAPIADDANRIGWDIRKAAEKLDRLTEDDRWSQSKEKVTPMLRGHLQEAIQIYTRILTELEGN